MHAQMGRRLKWLVMVVGRLVAIELFVPGGTLLVLAYLLGTHRQRLAPLTGIFHRVQGGTG